MNQTNFNLKHKIQREFKHKDGKKCVAHLVRFLVTEPPLSKSVGSHCLELTRDGQTGCPARSGPGPVKPGPPSTV
jgi:hypothetical protein